MSNFSHALPYHQDSELYLLPCLNLPWPILLDSNQPAKQHFKGKDIIAAAPDWTLEVYSDHIEYFDGQKLNLLPDENPFLCIERLFDQWRETHIDASLLAHVAPSVPTAGLYGLFSYDLGRKVEKLPNKAISDTRFPLASLGFYSWIIVVDHDQQTTTLYNYSKHKSLAEILDSFDFEASAEKLAPFHTEGEWQSNMSRSEYQTQFHRLKEYILAGDCYQANLAQRFQINYSGDCWLAYQVFKQQNPAPYAGYMKLPQGDILSCSPESFIEVKDGKAVTHPIKGTRPRGMTKQEDEKNHQALQLSEKDRAENLMIVDLLRNDFSRVCKPRSVKVPSLFSIQSYSAVHHLVSTIEGELTEGVSPLQLLQACFPGGSITGAPKVRAMEIIDELEPCRRSFYCGSMGYLDLRNHLNLNIMIRILIAQEGRLYCWAGGGIVADSECDAEYQETFQKVSRILKTRF